MCFESCSGQADPYGPKAMCVCFEDVLPWATVILRDFITAL